MPTCKGKLTNGSSCLKTVKRGQKYCSTWHDPKDESWLGLYALLRGATPEEKTDIIVWAIEEHPEKKLILPEREGYTAILSHIDLSRETLESKRPWLADPVLSFLHMPSSIRVANLQGAFLNSANLQGTNFSGSNLQGASLTDANLQDTCFRDADLQGAYLENANLQNTDFRSANLQGAYLEGTNLENANLQGANLQGIHTFEANLQGKDFSSINLSKAELGGANLQNAILNYANLEGAFLENANLKAAELSDADLQNAIIENAILYDANFHDAKLQNAYFRDADLRGANFSNANLTNADLGDANLEGAHLDRANLDGANLSGVNLLNATLRNVKLQGFDLSNNNLQGANFLGTNLQGANLWNANLQNAILQGANLQDAKLENANLQGADLKWANLQGAKLGDANLRNADLRGAKLQGVDLSGVESLSHAYFSDAWLDKTRMTQELLGDMIGEEHRGDYAAAKIGYLGLKKNFNDLGDYDDARWAYLKERQMRKLEAWKNAKSAVVKHEWGIAINKYASFVSDIFVEFLCGYGESISKVFRSMVILLFFIAPLTFFIIAKGFTWSQALADEFNTLDFWYKVLFLYRLHILYTLDTLTTATFSGLQPTSDLAKCASGFVAIAGTFLFGLLGFVAGNRIRRS